MNEDLPVNNNERLTDYLAKNYFEQFDANLTPKNFQGYQTKDGVLIVEPSGVIQEANETACSLMGFEKEELVGVSIEYFFIEAFFFIKGDWDKSKANSIHFEKTLFNFDRGIVYAEIKVYGLRSDKIFVIINDKSAICKEMIEKQEGTILINSKPEKGTEIIVKLPLWKSQVADTVQIIETTTIE
jgi:PAS domain-containing protein